MGAPGGTVQALRPGESVAPRDPVDGGAQARESGQPVGAVAPAAGVRGISRTTGLEEVAVPAQRKCDMVVDRSSAPHRPPRFLAVGLAEAICEPRRRQGPGTGYCDDSA